VATKEAFAKIYPIGRTIFTTLQGAAVCYKITCLSGHTESWWTDEFYERKTPRGRQRSKLNIKLATMLLITGGNFDPMKVFQRFFAVCNN
jgi:hypothetical protein